MRRGARARVTALCLCAAALVATLQCSESPEAPERTNPFDPGGVSAGDDALNLRAFFLGDDVSLFWSAVPIEGLDGARVYRLAWDSEAFEFIGELPATVLGFRDNEPHRDTLNVYAVTVLNAGGEESSLDAFAHDTVDVPPLLVIGTEDEPLDSTATRLVHVSFYSERAESVFLADSTVSIDGVPELISPIGYLPDPAGYDFLLREGAPNNHMRSVFGRTRRTDGTLSPIASDAVTFPGLSLAISVDGDGVGPRVTGRRSVAVALATAGAESMEVTFDSTFSGDWSPFSAAFEESLPGPGARVLRARVRDTFGAVAQDTFRVVGDMLDSVRLVIDGDAVQTRLCTATVEALGGAVLRICLSSQELLEVPDSVCFEGPPYDGPIEKWPLEPCGDFAHAYAVVANDWMPQGRVVQMSDSIFVVGESSDLAFISPDTSGADTLVIGRETLLRGMGSETGCSGPTDSVFVLASWTVSGKPPTVDSLAIGSAQVVPDESDPSTFQWAMPWTPQSTIPTGTITLIARATGRPCGSTAAVTVRLTAE
jgi:hypothetical protein